MASARNITLIGQPCVIKDRKACVLCKFDTKKRLSYPKDSAVETVGKRQETKELKKKEDGKDIGQQPTKETDRNKKIIFSIYFQPCRVTRCGAGVTVLYPTSLFWPCISLTL